MPELIFIMPISYKCNQKIEKLFLTFIPIPQNKALLQVKTVIVIIKITVVNIIYLHDLMPVIDSMN